jgi:VanZ family protein
MISSTVTDNQDPQKSGGNSIWSRRIPLTLLVLLSLYWLSLFVGTHIPRVPQVLAEKGDKTLHLCAYGGLAALLLCWRLSKGPVSIRSVAMIWLIVAGYGIFDEVTQPLTGRFCEFADWVADVIGATIAIAVTWPAASFLFRGR